MTQKRTDSQKTDTKERKRYVKPELTQMNGKVGKVTGAPSVPGPPVAAQASPVAPGAKVF